MAYTVLAYVVMAYIVMAYIVMAKGFVYYPPNWRVRFLEHPELFNHSLMENLRFGNKWEHRHIRRARVYLHVCTLQQ